MTDYLTRQEQSSRRFTMALQVHDLSVRVKTALTGASPLSSLELALVSAKAARQVLAGLQLELNTAIVNEKARLKDHERATREAEKSNAKILAQRSIAS